MLNFNKIECCNYKTKGRVYFLGNDRYFVFIDSCPICNKPIGEIRFKNRKGELKTNIRRVGDSALRLYEKYYNRLVLNDKIPFGTKAGEYTFINKFGTIFNQNGIKIAPQDKFLSMTRKEINSLLNKRFFTPNISC